MNIFLPDGSQVEVPAARPYRYCVIARPTADGALGPAPYVVHGWTTAAPAAHRKANKLRSELGADGQAAWWCISVVRITQRGA